VLLRESPSLTAADLMLVGAHCRDILHSRQERAVSLRATDDIDVGIALAGWAAFEELTSRLTPSGDTGIQFDVHGIRTDLLPFGPVERPPGSVTPPRRGEPLSVWAFAEVFDHADTLVLPTAGHIRIPTVPGYVALKLAAWLDRSAWGQYKDAGDIAAAMHWYIESSAVSDRLYTTDDGVEVLVTYDVDPTRGAVHLLGRDVAGLVGPDRLREIQERWPGERGELLPIELSLSAVTGWPPTRRIDERCCMPSRTGWSSLEHGESQYTARRERPLLCGWAEDGLAPESVRQQRTTGRGGSRADRDLEPSGRRGSRRFLRRRGTSRLEGRARCARTARPPEMLDHRGQRAATTSIRASRMTSVSSRE